MDSVIENSTGRSANGSNGGISEIAFECDDFLTICAPNTRERDSMKLAKPKKFDDIMKGIQDKLQDAIDEKIDDTDNPLKVLDECLEFYEQSYGMSVLDELDEIAMNEESKILEKSIQALETVRAELQQDGMCDIDMDRLREDFNASKMILNDTILTVFKDKSEEVTLLLSELLKNEFGAAGQQQDYLNLSSEQFSDNVVDTLTNIGLLEYNPDDDTQIRLTRLNS